MPIKQTRYVDIASAVIGEQSVPQRKLVGRIFTESPLIPAGSVIAFTSGEVEKLFPAGSPEAGFASAYFAYVSPAPASRAQELQIAPYAPSGRAGAIYGGKHVSLAELTAITAGDLNIALGMNPIEGDEINLSSATSFADVAGLIEDEIVGATVTYDPIAQRFVITGATAGAAQVEVVTTALATALGWTGDDAILSHGSAQQTPLEAFLASEEVSDSFGSAKFMSTLPLESHVQVGSYTAGENVKYQYHVDVPRDQAVEYSEALKGIAGVAMTLAPVSGPSVAHLPMAILAATDYNRTNAALNFMFRRGGVTIAPQVTNGQDADAFDALRINYYGQTASAGTHISFYQRGVLCGGAGAPISMSVYANEQWLKSHIAAQWLALLLDTRGIPANLDGRARGLAVIGDAITQALANGTIIAGKELAAVQRVAVSDASGDPLAWHDVQTKGYWYDVAIVPRNDAPGGVAEYEMQYTIVYSKGDWVNRIVGSHQLV